ncbi:MAG TPA: hypothetical protein VMM76_18405 [Pirellulaceae bacterium]|nr:hypothetical protein [Pirellulaceae bacterium]
MILCWARCVRRAFLCGNDPYSRQDYEHRCQWSRDLLEQLAGLFCVEVAFHAEMSNHLHVVLRTCPDVAQRWSDHEVVHNASTFAINASTVNFGPLVPTRDTETRHSTVHYGSMEREWTDVAPKSFCDYNF